MTESLVVRTGVHVSYLDVVTGCGLMVAPLAREDLADPIDPDGASLAEVDWYAMVRKLDELGFEPIWNVDECAWLADSVTAEGREVVALRCREHDPDCAGPVERAASRSVLRSLMERPPDRSHDH